jgi:hypothetical protein
MTTVPALSSGPVARPKPAPVQPVDGRRVVAATAALVAVFLGVVLLVRTLPHGGVASTVPAALLGLVVLPVIASPIEWFVHRFVYHEAVVRPLKSIFTVHTAHHYAYFPTWRYVTAGPARRLPIRNRQPEALGSVLHNASIRFAHFTWYMSFGVVLIWLPAWWLTANSAFLVGLIVSSVVVSNLFIVVHDTIHRPGSHRIVEAQPWFAFLDRHHYVHHVALGANLNFLLPLADLLFGTLRRELTPEELAEYGPLEQAKATLIGEGERARLAVA